MRPAAMIQVTFMKGIQIILTFFFPIVDEVTSINSEPQSTQDDSLNFYLILGGLFIIYMVLTMMNRGKKKTLLNEKLRIQDQNNNRNNRPDQDQGLY